MEFLESTACQFGNWFVPLVCHDDVLLQFVMDNPTFDKKAKENFQKWAASAGEHFHEVEYQLNAGYGLPEIEYLRIENCFAIINGLWQGAVCLTNMLLESFLKLALIYSNADKAEAGAPPLLRLLNALATPTEKYSRMKLYNTIEAAFAQGLISEKTKDDLHEFRMRFRNSFSHADMQAMFGDETTPLTGADFVTQDIEGPNEIPIRDVPLLMGEAIWQTAKANGINYFQYVDAMIRHTLPKVFPHLGQDNSGSDDNYGGTA
jgi:hypothetical protein